MKKTSNAKNVFAKTPIVLSNEANSEFEKFETCKKPQNAFRKPHNTALLDENSKADTQNVYSENMSISNGDNCKSCKTQSVFSNKLKLTVKSNDIDDAKTNIVDNFSANEAYDFSSNGLIDSQSNIANFTMTNNSNPKSRVSSSMSNILASDFYKLRHMKSIIIVPIVMFLLILLNYALFWFQSVFDGGGDAPTDFIANIISGKAMLFGASGYTNMGLFIAIICGIFIGGEFSTGTMRTMVAHGSSRAKIYFSKWIVVSTLIAFYTLAAFIVCGILTTVKGYGSAFGGYEFGILIRSIVLQMLVNISIGSVFIMISFLFRSKSSAMGISISIYFLTNILVSILFMFSLSSGNSGAWLGEAVKYIPSQQLQTASSSLALSIGDTMRVIFVPIAYIVITFVLGIASFIKRDVK